MDRESFGESLQGGYVTHHGLDLTLKEFKLTVEVLENGVLAEFHVVFHGISRYEFSDPKSNTWDRIEITDVCIEDSPELSSSEEWNIWFNFWDAAELTIHCAAIHVDGVMLS